MTPNVFSGAFARVASLPTSARRAPKRFRVPRGLCAQPSRFRLNAHPRKVEPIRIPASQHRDV